MATTRTIRVTLRDHAYDASVRRGLIADVGSQLRALSSAAKTVVLTDSNIPQHTLNALHDALESEGFSVQTIVIPPGEREKSIERVVKLYDAILPLKIDRTTPIIGLGGGVICDIAGFVAATLLRGVPSALVPTSLLAMVDASIGGKTGVNHGAGKNLIGAFHHPIGVFVDPDVLQTLPPRELRAGLAECIKHDVIRDAEGFAKLEKSIASALRPDFDYLAELVAHNVEIKAKVIMADPLERGERAHLNFGHTFGHAIEIASGYSYSHGESVALGMTAAMKLALSLEMIDHDAYRRVVNVIDAAGLPTSGLKLDPKTVVDAMSFDKKTHRGKLRFIIPDRIGNVVVRDDVPSELVTRAVSGLAT